MKLLEGGADGAGYLLKDRIADVEEFAAAVRRVGEGGSALDPTIVSQLVRRRRENDRLEILSTRDREVLELIGEGLSNQAIAERLFVSQSAVESTCRLRQAAAPAAKETTGACSPCWLCYVTDHLVNSSPWLKRSRVCQRIGHALKGPFGIVARSQGNDQIPAACLPPNA
jgi:hypothetical protein